MNEKKYRKNYSWMVFCSWMVSLVCMTYFIVPDDSIIRLLGVDASNMFMTKILAIFFTIISLYVLSNLTNKLNKIKSKSFIIKPKDFKEHIENTEKLGKEKRLYIFDFNHSVKEMSNEQIEAQIDVLIFSVKKSPTTEARLKELMDVALSRGMNIYMNDGKSAILCSKRTKIYQNFLTTFSTQI